MAYTGFVRHFSKQQGGLTVNIPRLTDSKLKTIKPQKKRYRIYINNSPGLYLLVGTKGNITFQFRYQLRGQRREIKIGSYPARTMQNLLAEYATFVDQVKQNIDPLREREIPYKNTF